MPLVSGFISMKCSFWISIHQKLVFLSVLLMVFVVQVLFFPLAWKTLIEQEFISYSVIMWIWFGLSVISLILGTIMYPWHNLPQDMTEGRSLIYSIAVYFDKRLRIQIARKNSNSPKLMIRHMIPLMISYKN